MNNRIISINNVEFTMIYVEGGEFSMGDENGRDTFPVHKVKLDPFFIGQTEVDQLLWKTVLGTEPSHFHGDDLPVETITFDDCHEFIKTLNKLTGLRFRLPTEAEWEYAAKGGKYSHGYEYSGSNNIDDVAWYDNVDSPQCVAQKLPNELGIYDMSGNVCEWCEDIYDSYTGDMQINPKGAVNGIYRLARGGGWNRGGHMCKVIDRGNYRPGYASNAVGMRLVLEID